MREVWEEIIVPVVAAVTVVLVAWSLAGVLYQMGKQDGAMDRCREREDYVREVRR